VRDFYANRGHAVSFQGGGGGGGGGRDGGGKGRGNDPTGRKGYIYPPVEELARDAGSLGMSVASLSACIALLRDEAQPVACVCGYQWYRRCVHNFFFAWRRKVRASPSSSASSSLP